MNNKWKKSFLTIAIGQVISLIGSSAVQFALIWWLAIKTDSPFILSMAGLVAFLPQFILGPFAGVWIDRVKKKNIVILADLFIGIVSGIFAIYFNMYEPEYWIVFVILGIRGVGSVFHTPAIQALTPMLVPPEELMRANGWNQFMQSGAYMLGPVIGGIMYGTISMPIILLTDLIGAIVASSTVFVVKIKEEKKTEKVKNEFWKELKEGVVVFKEDKILKSILITTFVAMICYMPLASLYPLMTSSHFKLGSMYGSLVEFLYAFGMLLISLIMGKIGEKYHKVKLIYIGLMIIGITSFIGGILPSDSMVYFWIFAISCFGMGVASNFYGIPLVSYMQETIKPELMGRAFSLWGTILSVTMPIGLLISGPISEKYGVPMWFVISGIIITVVTVIDYGKIRKKVKFRDAP